MLSPPERFFPFLQSLLRCIPFPLSSSDLPSPHGSPILGTGSLGYFHPLRLATWTLSLSGTATETFNFIFFFFCLYSEDKDTKVDWCVFMLRCLLFSVCSIRIERKVSPDLIYEIFSNMSLNSTRQDKEKCSKATLRVRSWKTRLEAMWVAA